MNNKDRGSALYNSRWLVFLPLMLMLGCASKGVVENIPKATIKDHLAFNESEQKRQQNSEKPPPVVILLAFSGGGHRAAALSYGVLDALRKTKLQQGKTERLLDYVDTISAVSGGSFTAAYYGLVGDKIFTDYKANFLSKDLQSELIGGIYTIPQLFSEKGRSEVMIKLLDESLFHGAKIAEINQLNKPTVILNASDLGGGVRLSFLQNYFDLLCSDVGSFSVARAVVASAAVPLVFSPIALENFDQCGAGSPKWLKTARNRLADNEEMSLVIEGLASFGDKEKRRYIHLVDGGITDNLGLRAVYENVELSGGIESAVRGSEGAIPQRIVVISVDASTKLDVAMDQSLDEPSVLESLNSITDVQLHRYNASTLTLFEKEVNDWAETLSTKSRPVNAYFINVSLQEIKDLDQRQYFNNIPTSLSLEPQQLEQLISAGQSLLYAHPEFKKLQADLIE